MSGGALTELVKTRLPDLLVPSVDVIMIKGLRLGMCAWGTIGEAFRRDSRDPGIRGWAGRWRINSISIAIRRLGKDKAAPCSHMTLGDPGFFLVLLIGWFAVSSSTHLRLAQSL